MSALRIVDTTSDGLQALTDKFGNKQQLHDIMARSAAKAVRENFVEVGKTERNRFGKPSTFWARMRRGVSTFSDSVRAVVRMPYEIGLRYHGGTIRPTGNRKALAIPAAAESYGKSPRSFSDLVFVPLHRGGLIGLLIKPGKPLKVLYQLVAQATIKPKPEVLPSDAAFRTAIAGDLKQYLAQSAR
jgi:hypothetical protein